MLEPGQVQARLVGSGKQAPLGKLTESMAGRRGRLVPIDSISENPWLPPASETEVRNRPSTKDWLDKVVKRMKEGAWSDEVREIWNDYTDAASDEFGIPARLAPGCVLREVFEHYIARIGEEDALQMAECSLETKQANGCWLTWTLKDAQEHLQEKFNDYDGSLWIHIHEEQLTDVQLLFLLYLFWGKYHPYVLSERTETQTIRTIKHKIEEEVSRIAHRRHSEAIALGRPFKK